MNTFPTFPVTDSVVSNSSLPTLLQSELNVTGFMESVVVDVNDVVRSVRYIASSKLLLEGIVAKSETKKKKN